MTFGQWRVMRKQDNTPPEPGSGAEEIGVAGWNLA